MLPDPKLKCPATGFKKSCRDILATCDCPKFVSLKGKDPQTGADIEAWGCVDSFLPKLLLENAQQSRQAGASIDALRSDMQKNSENARTAVAEFLGRPALKAIG